MFIIIYSGLFSSNVLTSRDLKFQNFFTFPLWMIVSMIQKDVDFCGGSQTNLVGPKLAQ